jgi:hypothetical protein
MKNLQREQSPQQHLALAKVDVQNGRTTVLCAAWQYLGCFAIARIPRQESVAASRCA